MRELQGRWPGLHWCRWESADGLQSPHGAPLAVCGSCDARDGERIRSRELSRTEVARVWGTLGQLQADRQAGSGMACSRAMARRVSGSAWRLSKWFPQFPGRSASADGRAGSCGQRRQYRGRTRATTGCFKRPHHQRQAWCPILRRGGRAPGPRPSGWSRPVRPCPIQQWD